MIGRIWNRVKISNQHSLIFHCLLQFSIDIFSDIWMIVYSTTVAYPEFIFGGGELIIQFSSQQPLPGYATALLKSKYTIFLRPLVWLKFDLNNIKSGFNFGWNWKTYYIIINGIYIVIHEYYNILSLNSDLSFLTDVLLNIYYYMIFCSI